MKLRSIALTALSFGLGAISLFEVEARTTWLHHFQRHTLYRVVDTATMPWVHGHDENVSFDMKFLYKDPATHEVAMLVRYPAGQVNTAHVHTYGSAMYVLKGTLVTQRGTYGPGNFVWFPADEVVSHGATPEAEVVVLFLRHEDMETKHVHVAAQ
jgi:quercetin dioxygenase-like cupin family protein